MLLSAASCGRTQLPAVALYEACGFVRVGQRVVGQQTSAELASSGHGEAAVVVRVFDYVLDLAEPKPKPDSDANPDSADVASSASGKGAESKSIISSATDDAAGTETQAAAIRADAADSSVPAGAPARRRVYDVARVLATTRPAKAAMGAQVRCGKQ